MIEAERVDFDGISDLSIDVSSQVEMGPGVASGSYMGRGTEVGLGEPTG